MDHVLFINACVRPESRTLDLARTVLERLSGEVEEVDLERERIGVLDSTVLKLRDSCVEAGDYSAPMFRYARQFAGTDTEAILARARQKAAEL